jgi:plasmid stabilization system protein ParE
MCLPQAAPLVEGVSDELWVRRVSIRRFPYFVAYLVVDEAVVVLAVAHERRRPRYWIDRSAALLRPSHTRTLWCEPPLPL